MKAVTAMVTFQILWIYQIFSNGQEYVLVFDCFIIEINPWNQVSLGREETFRVFLAIKHLVSDKKLKSARLFGKFFGLQKDYIIVESERRDDEEEEQQQSEEQRSTATDATEIPSEQATGTNKYIYWVTNESKMADSLFNFDLQ
jgi:hypothetical protein